MGKYTLQDLDELEACQNRFYQEGNYQAALNCAKQALKIVEDNFDTDSPKLCTRLENLAILYKELGRYKEAEELFQRSLRIIIKEYGPVNLDVPRLLNKLGVVLYRQGRYQDAEMRYNSSINNWKTLKGPSYHEIAIPMLNLGELYLALGKYSEAEGYINNALEIQQKTVSADHHSLAGFYDILGKLYYGKGQYQRALDYHNKALEIRRRVFGDEHPRTAQSINEIAMNLKILGHYEQAESMYLKALEIYEKIYDGDHPDIFNTRNNLALIYEAIGDYERADFYTCQVLKSEINLLGSNHHDLAVFYINRANLCIRKEDYQKAQEYCQKARHILEQTGELDNLKSAHLYNTLASICHNQERYSDAEKNYKKSIEIYDRLSPTDLGGLSIVWSNLAKLYQDENNYQMAEHCLKRAIQIREDGISPDHPDIVPPLLSLAILRMVRRNYPSALSLFRRILSIQDSYIDMVFTFADEEQKLTFIDFMSTAFLVTLSAIHSHMVEEDPKAVAFGFETVLRRKGIVLDAEARTNETLQLQMKGALKEVWQERSQKLSQLAQLIQTTPLGKENGTAVPDRKNKIRELQKDIGELERRLKKEADLELPAIVQPKVTLRDITNALPDGSALLEFVKIRDFNFSSIKNPWGITRYIVFIVRKSGDIKMVDLGNSERIDVYIEGALQAIRWESRNEKPRESLYQLTSAMWNLLEYYLDGIERLIVCPDGLINLVPFAALLDKNFNPLVKRFIISYVTSSREIVPITRKSFDREYQLVLAANPDFDYRGVNSPPPGNQAQGREQFFPMRFKRLEGTKRESELIPPLVPAQDALKKILTGENATKETVLSVVNPGILHLATHGFFNSENLSAITSKPLTFNEMISEQIKYLANMSKPKQSIKKTETTKRAGALAHSGLALAGANRADLESGYTEGLLTGLEVTGMQLSGTDLVVLSACDTGFGESLPGEGVFGLRRAFALAGAKNLVMSLWRVSDERTTEQMEMFYRNLRRMPPAEALRQAQLQAMEKDVFGSLPLFWAPFIIQGGQAQTALIYETYEGPVNNTA